ncbi:MAG: metallophosphoesterase [Gemmatimonadaceae bacterium]
MRYALISDIHANVPALDAVLADISRRADTGATYHLGDLVGYAPWPNETVERLIDARIPGVAGNYDSTVATDYKHCGCKYEDAHQEVLSHESYAWTRANVTAEVKPTSAAFHFASTCVQRAATPLVRRSHSYTAIRRSTPCT